MLSNVQLAAHLTPPHSHSSNILSSGQDSQRNHVWVYIRNNGIREPCGAGGSVPTATFPHPTTFSGRAVVVDHGLPRLGEAGRVGPLP